MPRGCGERVADRRLRDLAERDAARLRLRKVRRLCDVPGDRLALAVEVRGEIHEVRAAGRLRDLPDLLATVRDDLVRGLEVVLDVHAELVLAELLREVANVSVGGEDAVAAAEVPLDRLRLRRRLDDHQVV